MYYRDWVARSEADVFIEVFRLRFEVVKTQLMPPLSRGVYQGPLEGFVRRYWLPRFFQSSLELRDHEFLPLRGELLRIAFAAVIYVREMLRVFVNYGYEGFLCVKIEVPPEQGPAKGVLFIHRQPFKKTTKERGKSGRRVLHGGELLNGVSGPFVRHQSPIRYVGAVDLLVKPHDSGEVLRRKQPALHGLSNGFLKAVFLNSSFVNLERGFRIRDGAER